MQRIRKYWLRIPSKTRIRFLILISFFILIPIVFCGLFIGDIKAKIGLANFFNLLERSMLRTLVIVVFLIVVGAVPFMKTQKQKMTLILSIMIISFIFLSGIFIARKFILERHARDFHSAKNTITNSERLGKTRTEKIK